MEGGPVITVVVPTYHRNDLLARCLERLAPGVQTLPADRYRVVITDDGSQETAEAMVRERFPWACWVQGPREGRSANRNYGAGQARTPWVAFVDDDCVPDPDWLRAYAGAIEPGICVYEGKTTCVEGIPSPLWEAPVNLTGGALWSCNMMIARETFERLGGFDPTFSRYGSEDTDLFLRLQVAGETMRFVPAAVVDHPARPRPRGRRAAELFESVAHVWYKSGRREPIRLRLVRHAVSQGVRHARRFGPSRDWVVAVLRTVPTALYVARFSGEWEKTYRERYRDAPGAYPFPFW